MRLRATPIFCLSLAWLLTVPSGRAQQTGPGEYELKAAFVYNFAKFVEWPSDAFATNKAPLVVGVLGQNPFGDSLERTIRDKSINEHPLVLKELNSPTQATNCHIVFICSSEKKRLPEILAGLQGASVLTVGEMDRFTESGGMINFVLEGNKIRFRINEGAARSVRLKISSKLLSLAMTK